MAESKMPAKIWTPSESAPYSTPYIRADLVEPLVEALDDLQRVTQLHLDTSDGSELGYLRDMLCTARAALSSWEAAQSGQAQTEARG